MKKPTIDEIRDLWLVKYHNITSEEVAKKYPEESKSPEWFKLFPCTQEQEDEWVKEAKELLKTKYKMKKWYIDKGWPLIYIDASPYVKPKE